MAATTIFQQKAHRLKGTNSVYLFLTVICLLLAVAGFSMGVKRPYVMVVPGLGLMAAYRNSANRTEDIIFIVNKDGNEFYFTYKDEDKQRLEDVRIDEYRYWYYTNGGTGNDKLHHLVLLIETEGNVYCLKEKLVLENPPFGWEYDKKEMPDQKDVLVVPNLRDLTSIIDRGSEVEIRN